MPDVEIQPPLLRSHDADLRSTEATKAPSHYIPGLDGLRAIAIAAVLLGHGFVQWDQLDLLSRSEYTIAVLARKLGTAGVRLFFAISGFLITSRLVRELSEGEPRGVLRAFYVRRLFRIIPPLIPYLVTIAIGGLLGLLHVRMSEIAAAALFAANYIRGKSWFTVHFWSLSVEEHFYLFWAPLLIFAGFRRSKVFAVVVIVLTSIVRPLVLDHMADPAHALRQTHLNLDSFMYPCLFALLLVDENRLAKARAAVTTTSVSFVLLCLGLIAAFSSRFMLPVLEPRGLEALAFAMLVVALTLRPELRMTRLLEARPLTWLGRRSYGIYIWQELFFIPSTEPLTRKVPLFVGHLLLVLVIAQLSYRWLEAPMIRLGRRLSMRVDPAYPP